MKVHLATLGCRLNEAELEGWSRSLRTEGLAIVPRADNADVIVLNSCAVTAEAARKSRKLLGRLRRANPQAQLVLTGCLASLEPETGNRPYGVDLVVTNRDKDRLGAVLREQLQALTPANPQSVDSTGIFDSQMGRRTRAFVKVQDGCRNRCTFCVVTIARGQERSRRIDEIVEEINQLHRQGYQDAVLTGVHLGGYGSDIDSSLYQLVHGVLQQTTIPRLRLSSLEPWDISDEFWRLWNNPRLCPHLHLPLQSGADAVLRRMARRCDRTTYLRLARRAQAEIPDLVLTTDIIVGFPGETEQDFQHTVDLCREVGFGHLHIFAYSPREGTAAARMPKSVPTALKQDRSAHLHRVATELKHAQFGRFMGTLRSVLWEGRGESTTHGRRRWSGLTDNYLRVETVVDAKVDLENRITRARLDGIAAGRLQAATIL